jgi:AcrR family transcriptional regulator
MAARSDRRTRLLQEAQRIVAAGGLGAMTQRTVENAAGVPHGSVTYWFGSSDGLVDALIEHIAQHCAVEVAAISAGLVAAQAQGEPLDSPAIAAALAHWMDAGRELHLARLELELAGAREPRLRTRMTETAWLFWGMCEPLVAAAGSPDPRRDARAMGTMVDGLLLDRLSREADDDAVLTAALAHLLGSWAP